MFIDLQNNKVVISNRLMAYDTSISCGILQIAGINDTIENIEMLVDTSKESLIKLKQEIFKLFIISIIEAHNSVLYFLLSTNDISDYEDYHAVLDDLSEGSFGWEENPNSGNDIKLWVLHQDVAYW